MKLIKKFILTIFIFIITGCSVNYNLEINEDLSASENIEVIENTIKMQTKTNLVGEEAVNYLHDMFSTGDEDFEFSINDGETTGISNRSFDSLEEYSSNFTSDVIKNFNYKKDGNVITLQANQEKKLGDNGSRNLLYDSIDVNIKVPFKVIENNADTIDKDIYTWKIRKNSDLKEIKLVFNSKNQKSSVNLNIGNNVVNIKYIYIVLIVISVAILSIVIYVFIKNKKNNVI